MFPSALPLFEDMIHLLVCVASFGLLMLTNVNGDQNITIKTFSEGLSGQYSYLDVLNVLRISTVNSFVLNMTCPKSISFATSPTGQITIRICSNRTDSNECYPDQKDGIYGSSFQRGNIQHATSNGTTDSPAFSKENIPIQDVYNFYPLFQGTLSSSVMTCPFLQLETTNTIVVAHDIGYLYTAINHYKNSSQDLGKPFNSTSFNNLVNLTSEYYISISMGSSQFVCTYLSAAQEKYLITAVASIIGKDKSKSSRNISPGLGRSVCPTPYFEKTPSPTPSKTASTLRNTTDAPEAACFPEKAQVILANGELADIKSLQIGDLVCDGARSVSPIVFFTHARRGTIFEFTSLALGDSRRSTIILSASHLIFVNGSKIPTAAGKINVGDLVTVFESNVSSLYPVMTVERTFRSGLFNPHTASGKILISWSGSFVLSSTYTTAVRPISAHALLAVSRTFSSYHRTGEYLSSWFVDGNKFLLAFLQQFLYWFMPFSEPII